MDRDEALKLLRGGKDGIKEWNKRRADGESTRQLRGADLRDVDLRDVDLREVDLTDAKLHGADLRGANLSGSFLFHADLYRADLRGARLIDATLRDADLSEADLSDADLSKSHLLWARFQKTNFANTNMSGCSVGHSIFASDLSGVIGLETLRHTSPSTIGSTELLQQADALPELFLRGIGVPDALIRYLPSLSRSVDPLQYYSCFISYSTNDEQFATRLHNDLQAAGVRCWKWDHDARTGESLWSEIDQAIRVHDKLVLIASESSLKSPAVNREIERSIRQEDERMKQKQEGKFDGNPNVLFPVRVDDYIFNGWENERKADVTKKVIADATNWHDPDVYARVRDRLIRDLTANPD